MDKCQSPLYPSPFLFSNGFRQFSLLTCILLLNPTPRLDFSPSFAPLSLERRVRGGGVLWGGCFLVGGGVGCVWGVGGVFFVGGVMPPLRTPKISLFFVHSCFFWLNIRRPLCKAFPYRSGRSPPNVKTSGFTVLWVFAWFLLSSTDQTPLNPLYI